MKLESYHAPSLLPAGKNWQLVWHDEFDGTELDRSKWDFRLCIMQHRQPHLIGEEGVELDGNGNLLLKLVKKNGEFFSAQLQTGYNFMDEPPEPNSYTRQMTWPIAKLKKPKFQHKFGYYECRCRVQTQRGWWSAFWLQSPMIGAGLDPRQCGIEVDIMECFDPSAIVEHNNHWGGYAENHIHLPSPKMKLENPLEFHYFGLEWTSDAYIYYIDGEETFRITEPVSQTEAFILLSTECNFYRMSGKPSPELETAKLPDAFIVDFVRVYDPL